ncbi:MAG: glycerol kinase GlpK [Bdellovibrionaceae bacterium]|nr:glycerol kinase GlpK [Pseudobdellovibrionaceae bacterium]
MSKYIISIDQGTTSSRVCLFNKSGQLVDQVQKEFRQIFPRPDWVEHDPEEIWQSVVFCLKEILTKYSSGDIDAVGITNQRETVVLWDKQTGKSVYNAIVWQDKRTDAVCRKQRKPNGAYVKKTTGLVIDPYFSGTKIRWILDNVPETRSLLKENRLCAGTIDTFLIWKLTKGNTHATDVSNASRTLLMSLKSRNWDEKCLKIFGVPKAILPEIRKSNSFFGTIVCDEIKNLLSRSLNIHGVAGDQQAALFGQVCFETGTSKCTFGTGSFILYNIGTKIKYSKQGLLTTLAWELENEKPVYAFEGGAFICGAAVVWLRDNLGLFAQSKDIEKMALQVDSTEGVIFVSALSGLGAPYWKDNAKGRISGLTRKSNKYHLARATLESMSLQNLDIIKVMEAESGKKLLELKTDGGAAKNDLLMQFQSDFLQKKVIRAHILETTALGAAFLAGLGSGFWSSKSELKKTWRWDKEFFPKKKSKVILDTIQNWNQAVRNLIKEL